MDPRTGAENFARTGVRSPDRSESLYRLSCRSPQIILDRTAANDPVHTEMSATNADGEACPFWPAQDKQVA